MPGGRGGSGEASGGDRAAGPGTGAANPAIETRLREFGAGEEIFRRNAPADLMYLIEDGEVSLSQGSAEETVLRAGDFFGEAAVLDVATGGRRSATAQARTRCNLLAIDPRTFRLLLRRDPDLAVRMLRRQSHRLGRALHDATGTGSELPPGEGIGGEVRATLRHRDTGGEFTIRRRETVIGRADPASGYRPDVDLTPFDAWRSASRRHATLVYRDGAFFLLARSQGAGGTLVDGVSLEPGSEVRLGDRVELRFGVVELIFERLEA